MSDRDRTRQPNKFRKTAIAIAVWAFLLFWIVGMTAGMTASTCRNADNPPERIVRFRNVSLAAGSLLPIEKQRRAVLFAARARGLAEYGGLLSDYSRQLEQRWIKGPARADQANGANFSEFTDLGTSYRENIEGMQVLLFGLRDAVVLLVAALLPALPILFAMLPMREVVERLLHLFAGGMLK